MISEILLFPTTKMGKKPQKFRNYWQIKSIKVRLIVGYIDTNNLVQSMLNGNLADEKLARTKQCISYVKKRLDSNIPRKSLRTMAKDFESNRQTIKRIFNLDLHKRMLSKN